MHKLFSRNHPVENEAIRLCTADFTIAEELRDLFGQPLDERQLTYMIRSFQRQKQEGKALTYAVIAKKDEQVKGLIELNIANDGKVEIGYRIKPPARHQGYGSMAVQCLTGYLMGETEINEIHAQVMKDNAYSLRILTNNGYQKITETGDIIHFVYRRK